jgi:hypothetical protein
VVDDVLEDVVLVLEVAVEGAVADAQYPGDVGDGGVAIALLGEDAVGGVQDLGLLAHRADDERRIARY